MNTYLNMDYMSLRMSKLTLFLHLRDTCLDLGIVEMNIQLVTLDQLSFFFHLDRMDSSEVNRCKLCAI